jgi:hypothetical protein
MGAKGGFNNEASNTRGVVTIKEDLKTLLSNTISYIESMLDHGARTAAQIRAQMAMLLGAFDEEKAAAVEANGFTGARKKSSLEEALGETHDEFQAKLRKANGEPDVEVLAEAV